jgi:hypothetical protein
MPFVARVGPCRPSAAGAVSAETQVASTYRAIRMLADAALHARVYRTLTSKPGYHQTTIQSLRLSLGVDGRTIVRLDALRPPRRGRRRHRERR